jgi:hypothetical protein
VADTIPYSCAECGTVYRLPVAYIGKTVACKKCRYRDTVPAPAQQVDDEPQPPKKPALLVVEHDGPAVVYLDGYIVSDPDEGRQTHFRLTPGKHTVFVKAGPLKACSPCYHIDVRPGDKIVFEFTFEGGQIYFHWSEYRTRGEIKAGPLPEHVCDLPRGTLRKIWKKAPKENLIWEQALRRTAALVATGVPMVIMLFFLLVAVSGSGEVRIKLIETKVPAWVVGVLALGSVIAFVTTVLQPKRTLTITNRRTIYKCGTEETEIAHADLGAVSVDQTTDPGSGLNITSSNITITSATDPEKRIAISDTAHTGYIKEVLNELKEVASGAAPRWGQSTVPDQEAESEGERHGQNSYPMRTP